MNSQVLIHVGQLKICTTWLQRWMAAHPSIAYRLDSFGGIQRPVDICRSAMADQPRWYAISDENLTGGRVWPEGYTSLLLRHAGLHKQPTALPIGRVYPSLTARQLVAYRRFSSIWLKPLIKRLSWHRASTLYLAYAAWIVDRPWCDALIKLVHAPGRQYPAIKVTADTLERFRGKASLLANDPLYSPYKTDYLN